MKMPKIQIAVIPGDGIGPEIMNATIAILEATGLEAEWVKLPGGMSAIEKGNDRSDPRNRHRPERPNHNP